MKELKTEILIVGGGLGGIAAALAAARFGRFVIVTEETDWIGGAATSQAVPFDEHPFIESAGCTGSYRIFREQIRRYYREAYPVGANSREDPCFNPGHAIIGPLSAEPRVMLAVLQQMVARYCSNGQITILENYKAVAAETNRDLIHSVKFSDWRDSVDLVVTADYVIDATELGDLLELANVEHVVGAESQSQTGEPHALSGAPEPANQQAVTAVFAVDYRDGEDHTIDRPESYSFWENYHTNPWDGPQLGFTSWNLQKRMSRHVPLFGGATDQMDGVDYWRYRRVLFQGHFAAGFLNSDITLANWQQNDYWVNPLVGGNEQDRAKAINEAKGLSLSLLYWLQTEAPRHDGGYGYRELRLRPDIMGTRDGLAKHVYVRESRRIAAEFTVLEQHISADVRSSVGCAETFQDSVGIGYYRVDLHPTPTTNRFIDVPCYPFQIPLGCLIPVRVDNLLAGCKNAGVTHVTNGAFRMHPIEWNIGEAAGALAAYCVVHGIRPRQVRASRQRLAEFQTALNKKLGIELVWPTYSTHPGSLVGSWLWPPEGVTRGDGGSSRKYLSWS